VKLVLKETESDESVHVEKVFHGKLERISSTCSLVNGKALGPAIKTGSPVTGSTQIFAFRERTFRGVNTTRPFSAVTSSGSPGRRPSLRRTGLGRTTWPFVESFVSMVRRSYRKTRVGLLNFSGCLLCN
jgi:hypothetical protein